VSADLLDRLAVLDACAVSDALERHGLPPAVIGLAGVGHAHAFAGRAITVQLGPADGSPSARHLGTAAVDASGPSDVIVVANHGRADCAAWGGLLSQAAAVKGVAGVVIDGACRDVPEAIEAGLAIHARAAVAVTARGRVVERSWAEPVTIAGVSVARGDLVVADASGVAFVSADVAETVISTAERIARRERELARALRAGTPVSDVLGADYETMIRDGDPDE
jgi:4-hydroxy-4-methyl-2-oxoglutarate aldolase